MILQIKWFQEKVEIQLKTLFKNTCFKEKESQMLMHRDGQITVLVHID
jgi:hypothetical protein